MTLWDSETEDERKLPWICFIVNILNFPFADKFWIIGGELNGPLRYVAFVLSLAINLITDQLEKCEENFREEFEVQYTKWYVFGPES